MKHLSLSLSLPFFCLFIFFRSVLSLSPSYLACQLQKPDGNSTLEGCPNGTLYVSPTDSNAHFDSVQDAIDSLPETGAGAVILIGEGQYYEMINITRSAPLILLGQLNPATANVPNGNASQRNLVKIWNNRCTGDGFSDEETATLTIFPRLGYSFGNTNFRAYNVDFENRAIDAASTVVSPALVTSITLANASFYGCTFASYQDTWYTGWGANTYVVDSIIYGETDYLFGFGISYFESVTLANRGCGGGITAWCSTPGTTEGVYISKSKIIRSPDASVDVVTKGKCYLGRPWNDDAISVFLDTYMDESINPSGFRGWYSTDAKIPNTTYYAESGSNGPGSSMSARIEQDHKLTPEEGQKYTVKYVFQGKPWWIDAYYVF